MSSESSTAHDAAGQPAPPEQAGHLLEASRLVKHFGVIRALNDVSLNVRRGEVHAVLGENGAGKSTLVKILNGVYPVGSFGGEIRFDGAPLRLRSPLDARLKGIGFVPQEIGVIEGLSAAENVLVGRWNAGPSPLVNFRELYDRATALFRQYNIRQDPRQLVATLTAGQRQLVMIARALYGRPSLLILDEPTSSLTHDETENLLRILGRLRQEGVTCIFITHRLEEIFAVADWVTVLRDGAVAGRFARGEFTKDRLIAAMVGRPIESFRPAVHRANGSEEALRVEELTVPHPRIRRRNIVDRVSFSVRKGEVLGIAGLIGSGRSEVVCAIYGRLRCQGRIFVEGRPARIRCPRDAQSLGIGMLTEDRKREGLLFNLPLRQNLTLNSLAAVSRFGFLKPWREAAQAADYIDRLAIRTVSDRVPMASLSGGNQQKSLLARVLMAGPKILLLDEPTKGIDIGAKAEIYRLMVGLSQRGIAILFISSELPELLQVCDRLIVMSRGRLIAEIDRSEFSEKRVMEAATSA